MKDERKVGTLRAASGNKFLVVYGRTQHAASLQARGEKEESGKVNQRSMPEGGEPKVDDKSSQNGKLSTPSVASLLVHPVSGGQLVTTANAITLPNVALRECDPQRVQKQIYCFF